MATIVTRSGKGSALTHGEMDSNFTNLNTDIATNVSDISGKPNTNTTQTWTAQQTFVEGTLTDATNISWDLDTDQASKVTITNNRTLSNPTNMQAGGTYALRVIQDSTGGWAFSYGTAYKFPSGAAPTLTTTANSVSILSCISDGTSMYCNMLLDMG